MAAERQSPDAIISSAGLDVSGTISYIQDDPDSPDSNWFTSSGSNGSLRVSFPTPTGSPDTGTGVQEFKLWLRKNGSGGGDPTYTAELRETGGSTALQTLASGVAITSATGELETLTWDATNLGTADGSAVELLLTFSKGGGGPNERNIEVGAVEWNVTYTAGATHEIIFDLGTYSYSGNDIGLSVSRKLAIDAGSYVVTGNDITLTKGYSVAFDAGSYSVTGNDIGLTYNAGEEEETTRPTANRTNMVYNRANTYSRELVSRTLL